MSGLFAGVLLGRIASGYVGAHAGWRAMFGVATVVDLAMLVLVWRWLPRTPPASDLAYPRRLASLVQLWVRQPSLREACLSGFLVFAAFNVLWGALALMLARAPYHWGSEVVGLFGLAGVAGIVASPAMGRLADRRGGRWIAMLASGVVVAAFALLAGSGHWLACLLVGVLALDFGSRANLVANQTRLYALLPQARGRLNTVFMTVYFVGGATGSALGAAVGGRFGWTGLAMAGIGCAALAGATGLYRSKTRATCADDDVVVDG
jgi:predicted MFS family arabinose efflux permease